MNKKPLITIGASIVSIAAVIGLRKGIGKLIQREEEDANAKEADSIMEEI